MEKKTKILKPIVAIVLALSMILSIAPIGFAKEILNDKLKQLTTPNKQINTETTLPVLEKVAEKEWEILAEQTYELPEESPEETATIFNGSDKAIAVDDVQKDITNGVNPFGAVPSKTAGQKSARALPTLAIESVEVINGGDVQAKYRPDKVSLDEATGKYYTTERNASLTDARKFKVSAIFENVDDMIKADNEEAYNEFLTNLSWTYGGKELSKWLGTRFFNSGKFINLETQTLSKDDEGNYKLTAIIEFDTPYTKYAPNEAANVPYGNYSAVRQSNAANGFGSPIILGIVNTYDLAVSYKDSATKAEKQLGTAPIKLNLYDGFNKWSEMVDYAENLKKESEFGGGYINGRYVDVEIIGYSDIGTPIWNVVIADSEASVDEYLNVTRPMMEKEPEKLKEQLAGSNQKIPLYFNNIHPDETPGADTNIESIEMFLRDDKISYNYYNEVTDVPYEGTKDGYVTRKGEERTNVEYNVSDVLDKFIIVTTLTSNPDGRDKMTRVNANGLDLNRLSAYQTQTESVVLTQNILKWNPLTMAEYHGYVTGLLIEPCTGPHDPNYEYDLLYPNMIDQAYKMGKAIIGSTPINRFFTPANHYREGWDDGGPMYSPVFAMLFGILGYTIEIPYANKDSVDACNTATKALVYDCLVNRDKLYANKLEYFKRGIDNADLKDIVDPYFIDPYTDPVTQVGRPRTTDENGEERSFFPEYFIVPVDSENQYNISEAYRTMQVLERNRVDIKKTTEPVVFEGVTYPTGTYIVDMHQFTRGYINSMLSGGYNASNFVDMYAEITINFPQLRGFYVKETWEKDLFTGKTEDVVGVKLPETDTEINTEYVVINNVSQDVVKVVNRLLNNEKEVYMITSYTPDGKIGDFIAKNNDLKEYTSGLYAVTKAFNAKDVTTVAQKLVKPRVAALGSPIAPVPPQGSATPMKYVLEDLGFDFTITATANGSGMREDRNVIISDNINYSGLSADIENGIPYIGVRNNAITAAANLPGFTLGARGNSPSAAEAVFKMNILQTSPLTAGLSKAGAAYLVGSVSFGDLPEGTKKLMSVIDNEDNFVGGWWRNNSTLATGYDGKAMQNSTYAIYGLAGENKDVPVTLFGSNIFNKAHNQMYNPIFSTAIFMAAAKINDVARPYATADVTSTTVKDSEIKINIGFTAEDVTGSTASIIAKKYKITKSPIEQAYDMTDKNWLDYNEGITISKQGEYFVHWYAENSKGVSSQGTLGAYNIQKTNAIGTPIFTDGNGNAITALSSNKLSVSMNYVNNTDTKKDLTMYVVVYAPNGVLKYFGKDVRVIETSEDTDFTVTIDMPDNIDGKFENGYTASVFLWDSKTSIPQMPKYNFN